jgi:hypothetical protein
MISVKTILQKVLPIMVGSAAMVVLAMPMTAMAHDWNRHQAAVRHDVAMHNYALRHDAGVQRFALHHDAAVQRYQNYQAARPAYAPSYAYAPGYAYAPRAIYGAPAYAPAYATPYAPAYATPYARVYGAGGCANMARLQNVYRRDKATGHPAAANDVARKMKGCGAGGVDGYGYPYAQNGYPYSQNLFGQSIRNFMGIW